MWNKEAACKSKSKLKMKLNVCFKQWVELDRVAEETDTSSMYPATKQNINKMNWVYQQIKMQIGTAADSLLWAKVVAELQQRIFKGK